MADTHPAEKSLCDLAKEHLIKIAANLAFWLLGATVYYVFFTLDWWNDSTHVLSSINTFLTSVLDVGVFLVLLVWTLIVLLILLIFKAKSIFMEVLSELTRFFYIAGTFIVTMTIPYNHTHSTIFVSDASAIIYFLVSSVVGFAIFWIGKFFIDKRCG